MGWRRSSSRYTLCDQNTINSGRLIGFRDYLECRSGCYGSVGVLYFKCSDFSVHEDWTTGTNSFEYTFPVSSSRYYEVRFVIIEYLQNHWEDFKFIIVSSQSIQR